MSDSAMPQSTFEGSSTATEKIFNFGDAVAQSEWFKSFLEEYKCKPEIRIVEPCVEHPFEDYNKPIVFPIISHRIVRGWLAMRLLRFALWLGDIRVKGGRNECSN